MAATRHSTRFGDGDRRDAETHVRGTFEEAARALIENDFDLYQTYHALPVTIENNDEIFELSTTQELFAFFSAKVRFFRGLGATELDRRIVAAEFTDGTTIQCTVEARARNDTNLLQDSYPVLCTLSLLDGRWKFLRKKYGLQKGDEIFSHYNP